jgi:hypothetical protein
VVEVSYHKDGEKKIEQHSIPGKGSITVTMGHKDESVAQALKFRVKGMLNIQHINMTADDKFHPEFQLKNPDALEVILGNADSEAPTSSASGGGGFFSSIGGFFSGLFGGGGNSTSFVAGGSPARSSEFSLKNIFSRKQPEALAKDMIGEILRRNPDAFKPTLGRIILKSPDIVAKIKRQKMGEAVEDAFSTVMKGRPGTIGVGADIGNHVITGLLEAGVGELLGKPRTRISSRETSRSMDAVSDFRLSRSQQATELLRTLEKAKRNL